MSVHQIIYTSCRRGIQGNHDGQQIFSQDMDFPEEAYGVVEPLFVYHSPRLPYGETMTDERVANMPESFSYRPLASGSSLLALNTYLGRDYMGASGRFGNFMSHVVLFWNQQISHYPCEYYGCDMHRRHMGFNEVNSDEVPHFLSTPTEAVGSKVNLLAVIDFLMLENRMEMYGCMLAALLSYPKEKKKLLICAAPENIIYWIAALEYALPLYLARKLGFCTYEYDPDHSDDRICGVIWEGTRFDNEDTASHYVFHVPENLCPDITLPDEELSFFCEGLSSLRKYGEIREFHRFLEAGYDYGEVDTGLLDGFQLYDLMQKGRFPKDVYSLQRALDFARTFAKVEELPNIRDALIESMDMQSALSAEFYSVAVKFLAQTGMLLQHQEKVTALCCQAVFTAFNFDEEDFQRDYKLLSENGMEYGLELSSALMQPEWLSRLCDVLEYDVTRWRAQFLLKVMAKYLQKINCQFDYFTPDTFPGDIYFRLMRRMAETSETMGVWFIENYIKCNSYSLLPMTTFLDGCLREISDSERLLDALWENFRMTLVLVHREEVEEVQKKLLSCEYHQLQEVFNIFVCALSQVKTVEEGETLFSLHRIRITENHLEYKAKYASMEYDEYYRFLGKFGKNADEAKRRLFFIIAENCVAVPFALSLAEKLLQNVPLKEPICADRKLIDCINGYLKRTSQYLSSERWMLLSYGVYFQQISKSAVDRNKRKNFFLALEQCVRVEITASCSEMESYFDWIVPYIVSICRKCKEVEAVRQLFLMPTEVQRIFLIKIGELYLLIGKKTENFNCWIEYLGMVFQHKDVETLTYIGKSIGRNYKSELDVLDEMVEKKYGADKNAISSWKHICKTAQSVTTVQSIIGSFLSIFRH